MTQTEYGRYRSQLWREPDQLVVARILYGEARGEPAEVRTGVAWVIRNRAMQPGWWGRSWKEVCLKRRQFSCLNQTDMNFQVVMCAAPDDPVFLECLGIAYGVMKVHIPDPTSGATHYHDDSVTPYWARELRFIKRTGRLLFYREKNERKDHV